MRSYQEVVNLLAKAKETIEYLKNLLDLRESTIRHLKEHILELNDQIDGLRRQL